MQPHCEIGSNHRDKARIEVTRILEKIANQRSDALHKITTQLVKDYDIICVEDLAVRTCRGYLEGRSPELSTTSGTDTHADLFGE